MEKNLGMRVKDLGKLTIHQKITVLISVNDIHLRIPK